MKKFFCEVICPNMYKYYTFIMTMVLVTCLLGSVVFASQSGGGNLWDAGKSLIVDVYNGIAGISTVLAGCMSAVAVIGAKMSNNQHKVDQSWDWLKRIWIAWGIINGIGAFIAYIYPLFDGYRTIDTY